LVSAPCATHAGVYQNFDFPVLKLIASKYSVNSFGDIFKKYRKVNGLMQMHLAEKLGVDRATIYNWEHERYPPKVGRYDLSFLTSK